MYFIELEVNTKPMNIWIVAIDHKLQLTRRPDDSPKLREDKDKLEAILKSGIPARGIQFIGEEAKQGEQTIAMDLGRLRDPAIAWNNIDMTNAERDAAGISEALKHRPGHPDHQTMSYWIECRIPEDEVREDYFISQALRHAGQAQSILMLIGDLHVDAVAGKLERMGHYVTTYHELFPVRRWE